MEYTIRQNGNTWELVSPSGEVLSSGTHEEALAQLSGLLQAQLAAVNNGDGTDAGLLPEPWMDVDGIAFSLPTGDGRDFTSCVWTWRDPSVSVLPLMLQTETEIGHWGAELAGYLEQISVTNGVVHASGRFYDSDVGRQFRDMLLGGRRFGVSVDPGAVEAQWECVQEDEFGWCLEDRTTFLAYEIIGLTGTPFPGFAQAAIHLDPSVAATPDPQQSGDSSSPAMAASATMLTTGRGVDLNRPPRSWFEMAEPQMGDPLLVLQDDNDHWAVPTTITDDGQVFGHAAFWGQCHTGIMAAQGQCVEPPVSPTNYARANMKALATDHGTVLTCPLVVGSDHADLALFADEARDFYANHALAWADVVFSHGQFGPWFCGALRPTVTAEQVRVLRTSDVSGDWRDEGQGLDLILGLTVNGGGFPLRGQALAASGIAQLGTAKTRGHLRSGQFSSLVAANVVRRDCPTCEQARLAGRNARRTQTPGHGGTPELAEALRLMRTVERRTRHLARAEAAATAARITAGG